MRVKSNIIWECLCGNLVRAEKAPELCLKCRKIDNFTQVPQELMEERERALMEEEDEI